MTSIDNPIYISIAGITVSLSLGNIEENLATELADHYAAFIVPPSAAATLHIQLEQEPGPDYIPIVPGPLQIRSRRQQNRIEFESHREKGWADLDTGEARLTLREKGHYENFLRVLYAWQCLDRRGLLLHAAAVIHQDRGYVFFGHSGNGKTTISQLSLDKIVLSDDMAIVKPEGDAIKVYGVPFRGDMIEAPRVNAAADLKGLFAIFKDTEHRIDEVRRGDAVARLASCVPFVMGEPASAVRVMDIGAEIEERVPVRALHFKKDAGFWGVLDGIR